MAITTGGGSDRPKDGAVVSAPSALAAPATESASTEGTGEASGVSPRILAGIALVVMIITICVFVLGYRWIVTPTPSQFLTVRGDENLGETRVWVRPVEVRSVQENLMGVLRAENGYRQRFFLRPGHYTVFFEPRGQNPASVEIRIEPDEFPHIEQAGPDGAPRIMR